MSKTANFDTKNKILKNRRVVTFLATFAQIWRSWQQCVFRLEMELLPQTARKSFRRVRFFRVVLALQRQHT